MQNKEAFDADQVGVVEKLFQNRSRTFWVLQCAGWVGYFLVRLFHNMTVGASPDIMLVVVPLGTVIGFLLSSSMRYLYRPLRDRSLLQVLMGAILVSGGFGLVFSSLETGLAPAIIRGLEPYRGIERFGNAMFEATTLFAWSAIYFGYHYYHGFQEQQKKLLKAQALAHQAQLGMLRYQLNPHFLFNTLNAVSTLVLEGAIREANMMIGKLSSFLRYTLANEASHHVTVDQEMYALGLYLDIEKVRFEDRLTIEYEISDDVRNAMMPSLLLQPIIENAIKYAIAPSIEGGTIAIAAKSDERSLVLQVRDTGPGVRDPDNMRSHSGSGVGLVNIRNRLKELYGEGQLISFKNLKTGGFSVTIHMPLETKPVD